MEISTLKQLETKDYTLETPSGNITDIVFTLAGPTHPKSRALSDQAHIRIAKAANKRGITSEVVPVDPRQFYDMNTTSLVARVLGWKNLVVTGTELEYSEEAARMFFTMPDYEWIRDTVLGVLARGDTFIPNSSMN